MSTRFRVLSRTFGVPLFFLFVIAGFPFFEMGKGRIITILVLLGISIIAGLVSKRRYLTDVHVGEQSLLLNYLTPLAVKREAELSADAMEKIEVKEKKLLVRDFTTVTFISRSGHSVYLLPEDDSSGALQSLLQKYETVIAARNAKMAG